MKFRFLYRAYKARYRDQRFEINSVLSTLRPGDVAVDVGAHKGSYLHWMRKAVGPEGKVIAFEPQPKLAAYLHAITNAMRWTNVAIHEVALSDSTGTATLHVPGARPSSPSASLNRAALGESPGQQYECRLETLDRQLAGAGRVVLLKVDVEGHELQVFRGSAEMLTRDHPVILFECETRHLHGHGMRDVFRFLESLGYKGQYFSPQGTLPLDTFDPSIHQKRGVNKYWEADGYCNNFLFKHGD